LPTAKSKNTSLGVFTGGQALLNFGVSNPEQGMRDTILTNREMEVVGLMAEGMSCRHIARKLEISHETVRVHRRRMFKKAQVSSSVELIRKAIHQRWILYTAA
jgi:DNA-binding CsgD family transcriptional regulator